LALKQNNIVKPGFLLILFLGLAALILFSAYYELKESKKEMLHLMSEEAHSLLQSIIVSSQEVLYASDEVESEISSRLLNNANIIKILYNDKKINNSVLSKIASANNINMIHVFDRNGRMIFSSNKKNSASVPTQMVIKQLQPIFNDDVDTLIVGLKKARNSSDVLYVIAVATQNNDAIVLNLDAEELLSFKRRIGFGILIKRLTENRDVVYAMLENNDGILAASGKVNKVASLNEIPLLQWVESDTTFKWRIAEYAGDSFLEAVHPFYLENSFIGYYRIGLSLEPLENINERLQRRIIISAVILFIVGFIMLTLILVRQNLDSVKKQYQKIETYSKKVIESVSDAIVVIDGNENIVEINRAAEKLFKINKIEAIGKKVYDVLEKDFRNKLKNHEGIQQIECNIKEKHKEIIVSRSKFLDENSDENIVLIIKDLTEIKKLEKQISRSEQMNAMGQLASGVAHEIRNPLNSIGTIVQQLDKDFEPVADKDEYHSLAKIVSKEVQRMNKTIENFLRFSRPEPIEKTEFNLSDLLHAVIMQFNPLVVEKNIKLISRINWEGIVFWDKNQIKQVLINLIKNSMEAIFNDGIIELSVSKEKEDVIIKIKDNGEGIPKENLQKIFNLYFTSKAKGTGIGLSIIQRIINEHDGIITVDSIVGEGTVFTIILPVRSL
jgi:PAS domain S-box-containing protein